MALVNLIVHSVGRRAVTYLKVINLDWKRERERLYRDTVSQSQQAMTDTRHIMSGLQGSVLRFSRVDR